MSCENSDLPERVAVAIAQAVLPANLQIRNWLSSEELAARIGVSSKTLANWRYLGHGPRFQKLSARKVVYPIEEVLAWEASRPVVSNTIEAQQRYGDLE